MSKNNILIGSILGDGNILIGTKHEGIIPTTTTTTSTTTTTTAGPTTTTTTTTSGPFNVTADLKWDGPAGYGVAGTVCLRCSDDDAGVFGYATPGIITLDTAFFNSVPAGNYYVDFSNVGAYCISPPVQVSAYFCWIDYFGNCYNDYCTDSFTTTNHICSCHMPGA